MTFPKHDYISYPKSLAKDDYWGQVRRTVNGKPVSEEQILMIIDAIRIGLDLQSFENCLDLACGNGALSSRLFSYCKFLVGVDYSPYLVDIANNVFNQTSKSRFLLSDVVSYLNKEGSPDFFNKGFCYGSFSYLSENDAVLTLKTLRERFVNIKKLFIGNLPDKEKHNHFFQDESQSESVLNDHQTQIGIWRTKEEFMSLADTCGWDANISYMPKNFYASKYRFDAILIPQKLKPSQLIYV